MNTDGAATPSKVSARATLCGSPFLRAVRVTYSTVIRAQDPMSKVDLIGVSAAFQEKTFQSSPNRLADAEGTGLISGGCNLDTVKIGPLWVRLPKTTAPSHDGRGQFLCCSTEQRAIEPRAHYCTHVPTGVGKTCPPFSVQVPSKGAFPPEIQLEYPVISHKESHGCAETFRVKVFWDVSLMPGFDTIPTNSLPIGGASAYPRGLAEDSNLLCQPLVPMSRPSPKRGSSVTRSHPFG
jgi:hypothetical protein